MKSTGIIKLASHLKIFISVGQGWIADFKYPVLLAVALKVYLPDASNITLGLIALLGLIGMAFVGWFDLKYVKLMQTVAYYMTKKYNPYFARMERKIEKLK